LFISSWKFDIFVTGKKGQPSPQEIIAHLRTVQGNVPLHRKESKRNYTFSGLPFPQQLAIWDALWHTENDFWLRLHAYFFLERHLKKKPNLKSYGLSSSTGRTR